MIVHERTLIGQLLLANDVLDDVRPIVGASMFESYHYGLMFSAIEEIVEGGETADLVSVADNLRRRDLLGDISPATIAETTDNVPTTANAEYYARQIRESWQRREIIRLYRRGLEAAEDASRNVPSIIASAEESLDRITATTSGFYTSSREASSAYMDTLAARWERESEYSGIVTGLHDLDRQLDGLQPGGLYIVGSRTSIGKTALCLTIANRVAQHHTTAFFSLEMSVEQLQDRLVQQEANVKRDLLRGNFTPSATEKTRMLTAVATIAERKLLYYDRPGATLYEIASEARRMKKREGLELLIVDYIGLVGPPDRRKNRYEQIGDITKGLKALGRDLEVPVIAPAQISRGGEGKPPTLADLKESGSLEEDADVVILLHRDRDPSVTETEVDVAKDRLSGNPGRFTLIYDKPRARFVSAAT